MNNNYSPISDHDCSAMGMALIPPASHSLDPSAGGEARPAAQVHWRKRIPSQKQTTTSARVQCRKPQPCSQGTTVQTRYPYQKPRKARSGWVGKKEVQRHDDACSCCTYVPFWLKAQTRLEPKWQLGRRVKVCGLSKRSSRHMPSSAVPSCSHLYSSSLTTISLPLIARLLAYMFCALCPTPLGMRTLV